MGNGAIPAANDTTADVFLNPPSGVIVSYLDGKTSTATGLNYTYNSLSVLGGTEFLTGGPFNKKDVSFSVNTLIVESSITFRLNVGNGSTPNSFSFYGGDATFNASSKVALGGCSYQYVLKELQFDSLFMDTGSQFTAVAKNISFKGNLTLSENSTFTISFGALNTVEFLQAPTLDSKSRIVLDFSYITEADAGKYILLSSDSGLSNYKDLITINDFDLASIAWDAEGNLVANVIPEPSAFAAILAALGIALPLFLRRRK